MNDIGVDVFRVASEAGCCDACCLRFIGIRNPAAFANVKQTAAKMGYGPGEAMNMSAEIYAYLGHCRQCYVSLRNLYTKHLKFKVGLSSCGTTTSPDKESVENSPQEEPSSKKKKWSVCVCCLGVLQEETWPECLQMVKENFLKKRYECEQVACALSAPVAIALREKSLQLHLEAILPAYKGQPTVTALKEAWKWSWGSEMARAVGKSLEAGGVAPLLLTLTLDYDHDLDELERLRPLLPASNSSRLAAVSRAACARLLEGTPGERLRALLHHGAVAAGVRPVSVTTQHQPLYLGGRYVKLSRTLSQTPWVLEGRRVLPSSVQDIIFEPIAKLYKMSPEDAESHLKLIAAGREDVDVRCLGGGRPFAVEISDPAFTPSPEQLTQLCVDINQSDSVKVPALINITKEDLAALKEGEESKKKTYRALCVKLQPSQDSSLDLIPVEVLEDDIRKINSFRYYGPENSANTIELDADVISDDENTNKTENHSVSDTPILNGNAKRKRYQVDIGENGSRNDSIDDDVNKDKDMANDDDAIIVLAQKTPLRVLHRRPLLTRTKKIYKVKAELVPKSDKVFSVEVVAGAGTYIKEWCHGDLGRTTPSLRHALATPGAPSPLTRADILALDVIDIALDWPPKSDG